MPGGSATRQRGVQDAGESGAGTSQGAVTGGRREVDWPSAHAQVLTESHLRSFQRRGAGRGALPATSPLPPVLVEHRTSGQTTGLALSDTGQGAPRARAGAGRRLPVTEGKPGGVAWRCGPGRAVSERLCPEARKRRASERRWTRMGRKDGWAASDGGSEEGRGQVGRRGCSQTA